MVKEKHTVTIKMELMDLILVYYFINFINYFIIANKAAIIIAIG